MADTHAIPSTVLYCLWWPASKVFNAVRIILSSFLTIAQFILLPVAYLVQAILAIILFPFRLGILERFETLYIWLGVAGLVGCIAGAVLFLIFRVLTSALSIDAATESKARTKGRTIKDFRAARRREKEKPKGSRPLPTVVSVSGPRRRDLSFQAIMEEESEF